MKLSDYLSQFHAQDRIIWEIEGCRMKAISASAAGRMCQAETARRAGPCHLPAKIRKHLDLVAELVPPRSGIEPT